MASSVSGEHVCVHKELIHEQRVNALCRVCGNKSAKRYGDKTAFLCSRYEELIQKWYGIDLKSDVNLQHSKTMCRCCYARVKRIDSANKMSDETRQNIRTDITSSKHIWTHFDPNISPAGCVSCAHFLALGKGGRPLTRGERGKKRPSSEAFGQCDNDTPDSHDSSLNHAVEDDSDNDAEGHLFSPPFSTPRKAPKTVDVMTSMTPPETIATPAITVSPIRVSTPRKTGVDVITCMTPSPQKNAAPEITVPPIRAELCDTASSPHTKAPEIRPAHEVQMPLLADEQKYQTALNRAALKASDDSLIRCKTGGQPLYFMHVRKARKPTSQASTTSKRRRTKDLSVMRANVSGGTEIDHEEQLAHELKRKARKNKLETILDRAGHRRNVFVSRNQGTALRTHLGLSWSKYRTYKRFMKEFGIKHEGEKKERQAQKSAICGNIKIEQKFTTSENKTTNEIETHRTPVAYIEDLTHFVPELLDRYQEANLLDWHDGQIPEDEVWVKMGGDHGGDSFKAFLQVANLHKPNSKFNTFLVCMANCKDSHENLRTLLKPFKEQVSRLQTMTWKNDRNEEKKIRLFLFGDYDFLLKLFGLSGAQAIHPCLWCTASRHQLQTRPNARTVSESRSLGTLNRDFRQYYRAGSDKAKAKVYNNVIHRPIFDVDIPQVAPPYLHLLLGIVKKHHTLLENECHQLDKKIAESLAEIKDSTCEDCSQIFQKYVKDLRAIKKLEKEKQTTEGLAVFEERRPRETENHFEDRRQELLAKIADLEDEIENLQNTTTDLRFLCGPVTAGLDDALKRNKICVQAYHGRSLVGNHCNRYLKQTVFSDICDSVLQNTMKLTEDTLPLGMMIRLQNKAKAISAKFKRLNELYCKVHSSISHKLPVRGAETIRQIESGIEAYMQFYRENFESVKIIPKQHILECHCVEFIREFGFGLGLLGEQGGEECHATINILKSRTYGLQTQEDKLRLILTEHLTLVSPVLHKIIPAPRPRKIKRKQ